VTGGRSRRRRSRPRGEGSDEVITGDDLLTDKQVSGSVHTGTNTANESHDHGISATADRRYLAFGLWLVLSYMASEAVVGFFTRSLALLSGAAHMLSDAGVIAGAKHSGSEPRGGSAVAPSPSQSTIAW
jgi:hypothetical protein